MSAVEYSYVLLKKDSRVSDPAKESKVIDGRQFEAVAGNGKRVYTLTREDGIMYIEHVESGRTVDLPFTGVQFGRRVLAPKAPAVQPSGDNTAKAVTAGKFKP